MYQELSTAELAERVAAGNFDAESELVGRTWDPLFTLLMAKFADRELALDARQDAYCTILVRLRKGNLREPSAFDAYLRNTAINIALGRLRKRGRTARLQQTYLACPEPSADLLDAFADQQAREFLYDAIERLPIARDRDVLLRLCRYEHSHQRAADDLSASAKHVARIAYRARQRLIALVSDPGEYQCPWIGHSHAGAGGGAGTFTAASL